MTSQSRHVVTGVVLPLIHRSVRPLRLASAPLNSPHSQGRCLSACGLRYVPRHRADRLHRVSARAASQSLTAIQSSRSVRTNQSMSSHATCRTERRTLPTSGLPLRVATDADVPAITRLINAAFVVERPIFDHDRIDDIGVRDYMTKGKFLLHEDPAGNLSPASISSRTTTAAATSACSPSRPSTREPASVTAFSRKPKISRATQAATRSGFARSALAFHRCVPTTSDSATHCSRSRRCPPVFHPKIPCEFVVMEKRLTS